MTETAPHPKQPQPAKGVGERTLTAALKTPPMPGAGKTPGEYLLEKGWTPLGDPAWESCRWYAPGFRVTETYTKVTEPMLGETERYEAGKQLLLDGKIAENPAPRMRTQTVVTPKSEPKPTTVAYQQQLEADLRERERAIKQARATEGAHVG